MIDEGRYCVPNDDLRVLDVQGDGKVSIHLALHHSDDAILIESGSRWEGGCGQVTFVHWGSED